MKARFLAPTGSRRHPGRSGVFVLLLCLGLGAVPIAAGQDDPAAAAADTLATAATDSTAAVAEPAHTFTGTQRRGGLAGISQQAQDGGGLGEQSGVETITGFLTDMTHTPKAGVRTDVRINTYYSEFESSLMMLRDSNFGNTFLWSWDDFRQQTRTTEKRKWLAEYSAGQLLPLFMKVNGTWDWSEDNTLNNSGIANLSKRDYKKGEVALNKPALKSGIFTTSLKSNLGMTDQQAVNQNQRNDFSEAFIDGGAKVGARVATGMTVAARLFGRSTGGDRSLGENTAPSSALADSMGAGFYYNRGITFGKVAVTRSNFDRKYLDWNRNSTGQIDTVGYDESDKVVDELEAKDALSLEFQNTVRMGRFGLATTLSRTTNSLDYSQSRVGLRENHLDKAEFALTMGVGRDSFAVAFDYSMKWDDQRIKNATANRGKQFKKDRDLEIIWMRRIFKATKLNVKWHTGLGQDMAQNTFNANDKDRLRTDLVAKADRNWSGRFRTKLLFSWAENHDIAIHSTRSANNNIKSSYEVAPSYSWTVSRWITFAQVYRVYIQYTDYSFSGLEQVTKKDNYNKRGNMNTVVTLNPTRRLTLVVKHDYNKRFNASKTATDATGSSAYFKDQLQTISKINLGFTFKVTRDVTLEGATFRTRDEKETRSTTTRLTESLQGEIWVGARVNHKWGVANPLELSAMIKKFNAYGPSISEAASDFWEADVWLSWEF